MGRDGIHAFELPLGAAKIANILFIFPPFFLLQAMPAASLFFMLNFEALSGFVSK